jgi:hypothetical protein
MEDDMVKTNDNDEHLYKRHNKSILLLYHVFLVKCRPKIIAKDVEDPIKEVCGNMEICC